MIREKIEYVLELIGGKKADREMKNFADRAERESKRTQDNMGKMGGAFGVAGKAAGALAVGALGALIGALYAVGRGVQAVISVTASFEQRMAEVQAVTGAVGVEFEKLSGLAREMGRTTKFSASEAAEGIKFLGMAGLNTKQIFKALPATLNLASAGAIGLGEAADISTNIMSGMQLSAEDLGHVVDGLAQTARSSNIDIRGLGEAFKYVGPLAAGAKINFDQVSAAIGILGNAGLQGGIAGRNLAAAITQILKPSADAAELQKKLGLSFKDPETGAVNLASVLEQLQAKSLSVEQSLTLFGVEGGRAIMAMAGQGSAALAKLQKSITDADGVARRMAETQEKTLSGAFRSAASATEGLAIAVGSKVTPVLTGFLNSAITPAIRGLTDLADGFGKSGVEATKLISILKSIGADTAAENLTNVAQMRESAINVSTLRGQAGRQRAGLFGLSGGMVNIRGRATGEQARAQAETQLDALLQKETRVIDQLDKAQQSHNKREVARLTEQLDRQEEIRNELIAYIDTLKRLEEAEKSYAEARAMAASGQLAEIEVVGKKINEKAADQTARFFNQALDESAAFRLYDIETPEQRGARRAEAFRLRTGIATDVGREEQIAIEEHNRETFKKMAGDFADKAKRGMDEAGKKGREVFGKDIPDEMGRAFSKLQSSLNALGLRGAGNFIGGVSAFGAAASQMPGGGGGLVGGMASAGMLIGQANPYIAAGVAAVQVGKSIVSGIKSLFGGGGPSYEYQKQYIPERADFAGQVGIYNAQAAQVESEIASIRALEEASAFGSKEEEMAATARLQALLADKASIESARDEFLASRGIGSGSQSLSSVATVTEATANALVSVNESIRIEIQAQTEVQRKILRSSQNIEVITAQSAGTRFFGFAGVS
jgi:TP901 family phage tail tape measure protein